MIRDRNELAALLGRIRTFVREVAIPAEDEVEATGRVPDRIVAAGRDLGCFGWSIPRDYGGSGLTTEELALCFIELSQAAVAYRVVLGTNAGIGSESIVQDGTEEQKRRYLPRLATGELLGCLALTEEEAGSDATAIRTSATPDGDGWVLDGAKRYITLAPVATLAEVRVLVPLLVPDLADRPDLLLAGLTGRGPSRAAGGSDGEDFTPAPRRARWLRPVAWRRTGFRLTDASLLSRGGVLRRELTVVPQARVQSVALSRGLLERALDVASVHPHVVGGPVGTRLRLIDRRRAEGLFRELAQTGATARAVDVSHRWADRPAAELG